MTGPAFPVKGWWGLAVALGLIVSLVVAGPSFAQDAQQDPAASPDAEESGPVRIVPPSAEGEPTPRERQRQVAEPRRDITVNLDSLQGMRVAAGSPLWIVDPERNRIIACTLERTAGTPRIACSSRPLP